MLARRCLRVLPAAARPMCCSSARWAAAPAAVAAAAAAATTPALADEGPDPNDAAEAQRVLDDYFAATDPVPGGSGAVRLIKPLVDGSRGVDGYHASVAAAVRGEGGEPAQDGAEGEGRAAWAPTTLQLLREMQASFAAARDWDQFHTPRNLLIALVGEVGEIAEIFQWKGEVERGLPQFSAEEKAHVAEELSDVRPTDLDQHKPSPLHPQFWCFWSAEAFARTGAAVPGAAGGHVRRRPRCGGAR